MTLGDALTLRCTACGHETEAQLVFDLPVRFECRCCVTIVILRAAEIEEGDAPSPLSGPRGSDHEEAA